MGQLLDKHTEDFRSKCSTIPEAFGLQLYSMLGKVIRSGLAYRHRALRDQGHPTAGGRQVLGFIAGSVDISEE